MKKKHQRQKATLAKLDPWTLRFLTSALGKRNRKALLVRNAIVNAKKAAKNIGLPHELWLALTVEFGSRPGARKSYPLNLETAFLAGVAVGWHEMRVRLISRLTGI